MVKKESYETLLQENKLLKTRNEFLEEKIKSLNDNTIIESMNDMKEQFLELQRNTIPKGVYFQQRHDNKRLTKLVNAIELINSSNLNKVSELSRFINCYNENHEEEEIPDSFTHICDIDLDQLTNNLNLIDEFINDLEDDNECSCNHAL